MTQRMRTRRPVLGGMVLSGIAITGALLAGAGVAGASSMSIKEVVNASTTVKKLNQTVVIPTGSFKGSVNESSGALKGKLNLPPASTTVSLAGIGLATATFTLAPTKQVTGKINSALLIKARSTFNIKVTSLDPKGTSINLVGNACMTSSAVTLSFSGTLNVIGTTTVSGSYTIPPLAHCGLLTVALNAELAGPGNTFTATMTPI
jgi:hypothetical protein